MVHILRAHQLCMEGFSVLYDDRLSTVWSAPNYCYRCGNMASILEVGPGGEKHFNVFDAAPENERDGPGQNVQGAQVPQNVSFASMMPLCPADADATIPRLVADRVLLIGHHGCFCVDDIPPPLALLYPTLPSAPNRNLAIATRKAYVRISLASKLRSLTSARLLYNITTEEESLSRLGEIAGPEDRGTEREGGREATMGELRVYAPRAHAEREREPSTTPRPTLLHAREIKLEPPPRHSHLRPAPLPPPQSTRQLHHLLLPLTLTTLHRGRSQVLRIAPGGTHQPSFFLVLCRAKEGSFHAYGTGSMTT